MKNKRNGDITLSQTVLIVGIVGLILFALIMVPFYKSSKQKIAVVKYQKTYAQLQQANRMYSLVSGDPMNKYNLLSFLFSTSPPYIPACKLFYSFHEYFRCKKQ